MRHIKASEVYTLRYLRITIPSFTRNHFHLEMTFKNELCSKKRCWRRKKHKTLTHRCAFQDVMSDEENHLSQFIALCTRLKPFILEREKKSRSLSQAVETIWSR